MIKKLFLVIPVIFLLLLTNCSLFEDPPEISVIEPQDGDILRQGESFTLIAEIDFDYGVREVDVELWLPDGVTDIPYDSILCSYKISDEGIGFKGKFKLEKELIVPSDAPIDDSYWLQVNSTNWGGGSGYTWSVPVSVFASND